MGHHTRVLIAARHGRISRAVHHSLRYFSAYTFGSFSISHALSPSARVMSHELNRVSEPAIFNNRCYALDFTGCEESHGWALPIIVRPHELAIPGNATRKATFICKRPNASLVIAGILELEHSL